MVQSLEILTAKRHDTKRVNILPRVISYAKEASEKKIYVQIEMDI